MIKEAYCSFEVAKLLKEKGFNGESYLYYYPDKTLISSSCCNWNIDVRITRPTQQMACRWLREIHGIHIEALCPVVDIDANTNGVKYNVVISNLNNYCLSYDTPIEDNEYDSYEEAIEAACLYVLKNII